jgi:F-type H+-transporting ATPase subunit delta
VANERLAQTYAQAIFEKAVTDWLAPLKTIAASLAPSEVEELDRAGLAFSKKQAVLRRVIPTDTTTEVQNFLSLLASKNQVHLLPQVIAEFDRYAQRGAVRPLAKVTSAVALTDAEKRALEEKMRPHFGPETDFEYVTDQSILGGVIVRVGDKVIDGSVAGKLAALKEKLAS